jgi:hypothetical protein
LEEPVDVVAGEIGDDLVGTGLLQRGGRVIVRPTAYIPAAEAARQPLVRFGVRILSLASAE